MGRMRRCAIRAIGTLPGCKSSFNAPQGLVGISTCHLAKFSTLTKEAPTRESTVLVRDFIHSALYDDKEGYFATRTDAVGVLKGPLNFSLFEGQRAYMQYLSDVYKQSGSSWFTPVELFQPYYGRAIAEYILRSHNMASPLHIYEIGGGAGTCAQNILDHLKMHASRVVYDTMSYTSVEISRSLAKKQYERVGQGVSGRKQFCVECRDASDITGWGSVDMGLCFVIILEVLDNLPHDLVYRQTPEAPWMEMHVSEMNETGKRSIPAEVSRPLQDNLIQRYLAAIKHGESPGRSIFGSIKDKLLRAMNVAELMDSHRVPETVGNSSFSTAKHGSYHF